MQPILKLLISFLCVINLFVVGCGQANQLKTSTKTQQYKTAQIDSGVDTTDQYLLASGHYIQINGKALIIYNSDGKEHSRNNKIIRLMDEHGSCMSDGFISLVVDGNQFKINQHNCGGWFSYIETIVLYYDPSSDKVLLDSYKVVSIDKREPENEDQIYSVLKSDVGKIALPDLGLNKLLDNSIKITK